MDAEFLFDFGSPNAYCAYKVIPAIEQRTGARFAYTPILLGGLSRQRACERRVESCLRLNEIPFGAKALDFANEQSRLASSSLKKLERMNQRRILRFPSATKIERLVHSSCARARNLMTMIAHCYSQSADKWRAICNVNK